MKILYIQQDVFENYGIMILSAVLKKNGHECDVLVDVLEKDLLGKIRLLSPDIIGFSITSARYAWFKNLAEKIKLEIKKPIVVGGPHPTFYPELINKDFVDFICVGEGEGAVLELLNKLENGEDITQIRNISAKKENKIFKNHLRNLIEDLDSLPFADHELYAKYNIFNHHHQAVFMTSRGCPYDCTFCFNKKYSELYEGKGKGYRKRSVSSIIKEIKEAIHNNNNKINSLVFYDDTFTIGSRDWFKEFSERYKQEVNLPFSINARADTINDEKIKWLKEAGCNSIRVGLESANPYLRNVVLKKRLTNEQLINAIKLIKKHQIKFQIFNMLGVPGETLDTALETYELNYKYKPDHAWCSLLQPYPQTEIMEIAKKQKLIKGEYSFEDADNSVFDDLVLVIDNKNEIVNLQKLFQFGVTFRIPRRVMKWLIKFRHNRLFEFIFKVNYALGTKKLDNVSWFYLLWIAIYSMNYIKGSKSS